MREIYIDGKPYWGEELPPELDNLVSKVCDMFYDLTDEERKQGFKYANIFVVEK